VARSTVRRMNACNCKKPVFTARLAVHVQSLRDGVSTFGRADIYFVESAMGALKMREWKMQEWKIQERKRMESR